MTSKEAKKELWLIVNGARDSPGVDQLFSLLSDAGTPGSSMTTTYAESLHEYLNDAKYQSATRIVNLYVS